MVRTCLENSQAATARTAEVEEVLAVRQRMELYGGQLRGPFLSKLQHFTEELCTFQLREERPDGKSPTSPQACAQQPDYYKQSQSQCLYNLRHVSLRLRVQCVDHMASKLHGNEVGSSRLPAAWDPVRNLYITHELNRRRSLQYFKGSGMGHLAHLDS